MRAVVFAYSNIGCTGIESLVKNGFDVAAVFTHSDSPGEKVWFRSAAETASKYKIPVYAPADVNSTVWVKMIQDLKPDIIFSFYYRDMLKPAILDIPPKGCLNLHGSYLPAYRGRCPINWVLVNGEKETGVSLHYMTAKPDDGGIVAQMKIPISLKDTALSLHLKADAAAAKLLEKALPKLKAGKARSIPQDKSKASYFGGRKPKDGQIDWSMTSTQIRNLVRAVTRPFPGAFTFTGGKKYIFWEVTDIPGNSRNSKPGQVISSSPLVIACGKGAVKVDFGEPEGGLYMGGEQLSLDCKLVKGMSFRKDASCISYSEKKKSVLILGANGFIGSALSEKLLKDGRYEVHSMDLRSNYLQHLIGKPNFNFNEGDIAIQREWIEYHVRKCDVIVPLVAIATPIEYTRNPIRVFELDFEENLRIVRYCVKYGKRIIFPSTSEVYGMCDEEEFDEDNSKLILGPIRMQRWIYSCCKQLLDRVIWAYGQKEGLKFTLFRPFNWVGPRLDTLDSARIGSSRAITQLILNLVEGTPILLIDGGNQKRCFTDLADGIECLFRIIEDKDDLCNGKIINIGNPVNEASIAELARILVDKFEKHPMRGKFPPFAGFKEVESLSYYGQGYQDVQFRKPKIANAAKYVKWKPRIPLDRSVDETLDFFLKESLKK
ncbi:MAG TPA: bifunctional UDP-glucuronic acid oxidase/UDP-4-amino-4-deoxy-L-arabinose formyltransferase [Lentisphaeria bacterium]|nr:MAG: bifunctional UDP-glucuronic acid oxidase/UDP-4-amino-4-deoxy-L-arabinose formyltransferase [Lentisphaerae bacterium GWF2_50_93]HCE46629.1 bifunctional UDP-glucuronic acid oxidase/UDP-4-amino-4-deoxy-L-arabinose formyltransferase [Lentisphaeria bacterium]